jgi:hypothetical protein
MKDLFVLITLIDITQTGVLRGEGTLRDQQRNFETVLQVLGLKTQAHIVEGPVKITDVSLKKYNQDANIFGEFYREQDQLHNIWGLKFTSEHSDVYSTEQLYNDFDQVPIILGLEETAKFLLPLFHSYGTLKNIHFFSDIELNNT